MIEYRVEVYKNGTEYWYDSKDQLHREGDKPAIFSPDGYKLYCIKGKKHRENGPARIRQNGAVEYWLNGERLTRSEHERQTQKVLKLKVSEIEAKYGCKVNIVKGEQ